MSFITAFILFYFILLQMCGLS